MSSWLRETLDQLGALPAPELVAALACYVVSVAARATAWANVVATAGGPGVSRAGVGAAFLAGTGVNAVAPARAGTGVRLLLARAHSRRAGWSTLVGTLGVEAIVNTVVATLLVSWVGARLMAAGADVLPAGRYLALGLAACVGGGALLAVAARLARGRARRAVREAADAFRILGRPRLFVTRVLVWQALDWTARLATIAFVLRAAGLEHGPTTVLLVQAALCIAMLLPLTPAGVGAKQGAIVLVLAGIASSSTLVAFGVALGLVHAAADVVLALLALASMLRNSGGRDALRALAGRIAVARALR